MVTASAESGISLRLAGAIHDKIRENRHYQSKAVYTLLALNQAGKDERSLKN